MQIKVKGIASKHHHIKFYDSMIQIKFKIYYTQINKMFQAVLKYLCSGFPCEMQSFLPLLSPVSQF